MAQSQARQLNDHELTFLMQIKGVGRVSHKTLMGLGMGKELLQKLVDSDILVASASSEHYTVNDDVFKQ